MELFAATTSKGRPSNGRRSRWPARSNAKNGYARYIVLTNFSVQPVDTSERQAGGIVRRHTTGMTRVSTSTLLLGGSVARYCQILFGAPSTPSRYSLGGVVLFPLQTDLVAHQPRISRYIAFRPSLIPCETLCCVVVCSLTVGTRNL